ncbi:hypothetical protein HNQ43_000908 [Faecalicoccus acidiformans]|uniref:Uncharacterized protein n=1 Tax=Faecalicoccus acidiformans TaxID=915173 RepID=A0A7W8D2H2_9FIRM|nr:hypothetical protein [Faecalicoccus acidiformans]MBB5184862.1 hypothetical protein [Faecalicoccus acidiformans]
MKWYQNKKIVVGTVAAIVVCLAIVYAITSQPSIVVKTQEIEAGDKVSLTKESLLDTEKMDAELVDDIKITSNLMTDTDKYSYNEESGEVTSKDETYLEAGTYTVTITYGDKTEDVEIKVTDSKAPEFVGFRDTITVEQNAEGFDLSRYYLAEDKSKVTVESKEETDISKAETQTNTIVGTDEFDNSTEKECKIKVVTQEDIKNGTKLTPMVDGNVPLSKDTLEKAKSGDIDVQVEDLNEELKTAYADIKEDKINGTTSFKKVEDDDKYFNRDAFTNTGNISMESLGMDYKEYREFVNKNLLDDEGHVKGTYNKDTNSFEGIDENGNSFSIDAGGLGIQPGEGSTPAGALEAWQQQQGNGNQSSNPNTGNSGQTNPGGTTTTEPTQPVEPDVPACDDTIPAGFWANRADAEAYAQQVIMDALLSGQASHGGYYVDIYRTECGTKYYGITFK